LAHEAFVAGEGLGLGEVEYVAGSGAGPLPELEISEDAGGH
jgi:hypothetical protein